MSRNSLPEKLYYTGSPVPGRPGEPVTTPPAPRQPRTPVIHPPDPNSERSKYRRNVTQVGINRHQERIIVTLECGHTQVNTLPVTPIGTPEPDYTVTFAYPRICKQCRQEGYAQKKYGYSIDKR